MLAVSPPLSATDLVVVVGAAGSEEYGPRFAAAAEVWEKAGQRGDAAVHVVDGGAGDGSDFEKLGELVPELAAADGGPLWIVLIGHGTFDGREAKFNLRGEDLTAAALDGWLEGTDRQVAVIHGGSSSAPFLQTLSAPGRVIVTATKSASEESYARFGEFMATGIDSPEADRDRDGATSLLEAFLAASAAVAEFYQQEGRIATEEALLDDNGDGFGTPADWFRGVRAIRTAKDGAEPDGRRAHQLQLVPGEDERRLSPEQQAQRNALEEELFALRARKEAMEEDKYFEQLERILRQIGEIYAAADDS